MHERNQNKLTLIHKKLLVDNFTITMSVSPYPITDYSFEDKREYISNVEK